MTFGILVNRGSGNSWLPDNYKSLHEPMLISHQEGPVQWHLSSIKISLKITYLKFHSNPRGERWVNAICMLPLYHRLTHLNLNHIDVHFSIENYHRFITDLHFSWICFQITHFTQIWQILSIRLLFKEDMAHLITLNLGKSWEKYAKSFDAGLILIMFSVKYRNT